MPSDRKMAIGILIASRALMNRQTLEYVPMRMNTA